MASQELHLGGTETSLLGAAPDHPVHRVPGHRVRTDRAGGVGPGEQRPARFHRFGPGAGGSNVAPRRSRPVLRYGCRRFAGAAQSSLPAAAPPASRCSRHPGSAATERTRRVDRSPGPRLDGNAFTCPRASWSVFECRIRTLAAHLSHAIPPASVTANATSSDRRRAPANPINRMVMSRRAATPAGQPAACPARCSSRARTSSRAMEHVGFVESIGCGRIPDNARCTTSAPPGASRPAVWKLVNRGHPPVRVAGVYRPFPTPVYSAVAPSRNAPPPTPVPATGRTPARSSTGEPGQPDRYAALVFSAVDASTTARTSARARSVNTGSAAAVRLSLQRRHRQL